MIQGCKMQVLHHMFSHTIKVLLFLAVIITGVDVNAQEKAASIVLKETFGSDSYNRIVYQDGTVVVSGLREEGRADAFSQSLDILKYGEAGLELVNQIRLSNKKDRTAVITPKDMITHNGHFLIFGSSSLGNYLISARSSDNSLVVVDELKSKVYGYDAKLIAGDGDNVYVIASGSAGITVEHFTIANDGTIKQSEHITFGVAPNEPNYFDNFSASYSNQVLYITSNQDDIPAVLYRLPLYEDGRLGEATTLTFENAKSAYHTSKVTGDLWLLSYHYWGFQVAKIEGNKLSVIYESNENTWYNKIEIKGNLFFGFDTFSGIDVYEIGNNHEITYKSKLQTNGFLRDAQIVGDEIFFTKSAQGIEVAKIHGDGSVTRLSSFNQSGQVIDMAMHENELAVAALDNNLHFWSLSENEPALKSATYNTVGTLQGVAWNGDKVVINHDANLESHLAGNLKNNVGLSESHGSLGWGGRDGQIIKIKNGYVAQAFHQLYFIDELFNIVSSIELGSIGGSYNLIQQLVSSDNLLFVPLYDTADLIIYDTSDLSNIVELTRIDLDSILIGNIAVKGAHLYVPRRLDANDLGITTFDISNPEKPVELFSVLAGGGGYNATLHIDGNFLMAVGDKGTLFDISDPVTPVKIDENLEISSNGIGLGSGKNLFTVSRNTGGRIHRSQVNLAPTHLDLSMAVQEEGQVEALLSATDNENDAVTYSIVSQPEKGSLSIKDNAKLVFKGANDKNGADKALLLITDVHGGASQFEVVIDIEPVNDAPAFDQSVVSISVISGQSQTTALVAQDVDGDTLTYAVAEQAGKGEATVNHLGEVTYTANADATGTDIFVVSATDPSGEFTKKTVSVTIVQPNHAPVFDDTEASISVVSGQSQTVILTASDSDGDTLTYAVAEQAGKGIASINQLGEVTYMANADVTGADSFVVTVSDISGGSASKTVSVTISAPVSQTTNSNTKDNTSSSEQGSSGGSLGWYYLLVLVVVLMQRRSKLLK